MKVEVEQKFPVADLDTVARAVLALGATQEPDQAQSDHYFAHPARDFARTDEALRIRQVGDANFVTYKGPKLDTATKTRRELELPLTAGPNAAADFGALLAALGFRPVATVQKRRRAFHLKREPWTVEIALDRVEGVGQFVEVEIAASEADLPAAQACLARVVAELGLEISERRSYLELLLATRGS